MGIHVIRPCLESMPAFHSYLLLNVCDFNVPEIVILEL
jgi:hypothetical protein